MIRYFFSYYHTNGHGHFGFGNRSVSLRRSIRSYEDVEAIAAGLEREVGLSGVVILNWRRFEDAE